MEWNRLSKFRDAPHPFVKGTPVFNELSFAEESVQNVSFLAGAANKKPKLIPNIKSLGSEVDGMSDKHLGRIENTGDSTKQEQQFSQPWTPQMMTPKLDLSGTGTKMPEEFGNFQLVDNNGGENRAVQYGRPLQGSADFKQQTEAPRYHSAYDTPTNVKAHNTQLHTGAMESHTTVHKTHQTHKQESLVGQTTIPASRTPDGDIPSEKLSTDLPASMYKEGAHYRDILTIPPVPGHTNYYNGLANAHYEKGHLKGVPVHVVNGQVASHLGQEVDIPLHKK